MKYELINKPIFQFSPIEQILVNRGIKPSDLFHYLHLFEGDICNYESFGLLQLETALKYLINCIKNQ